MDPVTCYIFHLTYCRYVLPIPSGFQIVLHSPSNGVTQHVATQSLLDSEESDIPALMINTHEPYTKWIEEVDPCIMQ